MPDENCVPTPAGPQGQHVKHSDDCDGYTSRPTYVRIYHEEDMDYPWQLDGADGQGHYTEHVESFATFEEATAAAPTFIEWCATYYGVTWQWDVDRPMREVPSQRVLRERIIHP